MIEVSLSLFAGQIEGDFGRARCLALVLPSSQHSMGHAKSR
jgi:hypothetical protein